MVQFSYDMLFLPLVRNRNLWYSDQAAPIKRICLKAYRIGLDLKVRHRNGTFMRRVRSLGRALFNASNRSEKTITNAMIEQLLAGCIRRLLFEINFKVLLGDRHISSDHFKVMMSLSCCNWLHIPYRLPSEPIPVEPSFYIACWQTLYLLWRANDELQPSSSVRLYIFAQRLTPVVQVRKKRPKIYDYVLIIFRAACVTPTTPANSETEYDFTR